MTPEPLDRPLTLVDKQNGISTFSFSQSTDRVPLTSKYIHVYNSSSWVQNWKQNWNSCPFSIFMIKTSFTLFFLKKTTQKSRFSIKTFFSINQLPLAAIKRQTLSGTENLQKEVFGAFQKLPKPENLTQISTYYGQKSSDARKLNVLWLHLYNVKGSFEPSLFP